MGGAAHRQGPSLTTITEPKSQELSLSKVSYTSWTQFRHNLLWPLSSNTHGLKKVPPLQTCGAGGGAHEDLPVT